MKMKLSPQQEAAVLHMGSPALVTAGAGSGKTRTLTAKIAHLISLGYPPERILAITFTNKAADEMKRRLVEMTGIPETGFPWVRTYHSACYKILCVHCGLLGYTTPLQIYDMYHQRKTITDVLIRMNHDKKFVPVILNHISRAKNSGNPAAYLDAHPFVSYVRLADAYELYERMLKEKNAVDFDNILLCVRNILRDHDDVRRRYQERFEFILVDEYQDTNNLQEDLTGLLCRGDNLFCVGDDWQAIYSFRGSNMRHFLSFEQRYADARVFKLEQNYRSADTIVRIANDIIDYNRDKMDKTCFSEESGGTVEIYEFDDEGEEARWVARKAEELNEDGVPYDAMAVLYRTKFTSLYFEHAFRRAGIPYHLLGDRGFYDRKEVMDINSYLMAAVFEKDDTAFERIINIPRRGIGAKTLASINDMRTGAMSLQAAVHLALAERRLSDKVYHALSGLMALLDDIREMRPEAAIREVIERIGYLNYLKQYADAGSMDFTEKVENIDQLVSAASRMESLTAYLEEAALIREDKDEEEGGFGINLATIHAAKGLEFHTVFVVGCEENLFPHWKSLEEEDGLQEERRLMYVAATRAARCLFLTAAGFRKGQFNKHSRFLFEIERAL